MCSPEQGFYQSAAGTQAETTLLKLQRRLAKLNTESRFLVEELKLHPDDIAQVKRDLAPLLEMRPDPAFPGGPYLAGVKLVADTSAPRLSDEAG